MYWTPDPDHPLTKICSKCKQEKHLMEFYLDRRTGRRLNQCKACMRIERRRRYAGDGTRCRKQPRPYTADAKQEVQEPIRQSKVRHPHRRRQSSRRDRSRRRARQTVRAVSRGLWRLGLLDVGDRCVECGGQPVVLHHVDYSDPYRVVPLCHRCHMRRHFDEWRRTGGGPVKYPDEYRDSEGQDTSQPTRDPESGSADSADCRR